MPAAQQQINYGNTANDGQGDPLRTAFIKVDDNFDAIWAAGPVGSNVTIQDRTISTVTTNGDLVISANGVGVIRTNSSLIPAFANALDLGSANLRYRSLFVGPGGANISGNIAVASILTDNYFYANGAPFSPGSDYGNANVADFLPVYQGDISANSINVNSIVNEFPVNITTNGGDTWQFAGNILRGPQGGSWTSAAGTIFLNSPANGFVNISSLQNDNVVSEIFVEHSFIRFFVDNGLPAKTWQMNLDGSFSVPGDIIPQSNGTASLGNATNQWDDLWIANSIVSGNVTTSNANITTSFGLPVYADDTARDAAISSPQPGMMVFVTGTGLQVRGATAWNTVANTEI